MSELGKGTFGKVYKCTDTKHQDTVALKVVRSIKRYIHSAKIEARICDDVYKKQKEAKSSFCVKMFAQFAFRGMCMTYTSSLFTICHTLYTIHHTP
ncbi:hypothetical protein EON63_00215 [archaeon]|nr:MAG: hypothetical protein EON63_00215 [archaeon]